MRLRHDSAYRQPLTSLATPRSQIAAMTVVEMAVGIAVLGLVVATALTCLTALNRNAFSGRVMSSARELVQSNIEQASCVPFSSGNEPDILAKGTSTQTATVYTSRDGTGPSVTGSLKRTVATASNALGADIRQVTFHLDYQLYGRAMTYEMTTMRAMDK